MCLYPKLIINKRYRPTKKNNHRPPKLEDERIKYVPVPCGNCIECRKKEANGWRIRLMEEYLQDHYATFVTLTFNDKSLNNLCSELGLTECNAVATVAVRRFLERWRKKYHKSVKHWLITELGHKGTERVHLHGVIWSQNVEDIRAIWGYGFCYFGKFVNEKTMNYITKYITKIDKEHKGFKGKVLCSKGIGENAVKKLGYAKFDGVDTNQFYIANNGLKLGLPTYYRNKLYNEEQRQELWINKLNEQVRFVLGQKISIKNTEDEFYKVLHSAQIFNKRLGFGDNSQEWKKAPYNVRLTDLQRITRIKKEEERRKKVRESVKVMLK